MLIQREISEFFQRFFTDLRESGLIVGGVVGCGKTTAIKQFLSTLKIPVIEFTGDDTVFRASVISDSKYIYNMIRSQTHGRCFLFVDEVQKCEEIFDAIKYAYDHHPLSFIVSGSNPDFLNTSAKKRLQRRAEFVTLYPFSLPELISHNFFPTQKYIDYFHKILTELDKVELPEFSFVLTDQLKNEIEKFLSFGGIPRAYLASNQRDQLIEIKQVVERGFESLSRNNNNISDSIIIEMANLNSQEFAYQGIFQRTGLRRRESVNAVIDQLVNHGYIIKKKPIVLEADRSSYLSIYSWIDPGIITYLTGDFAEAKISGSRVESLVFARLKGHQERYPMKSELGYFKPHVIYKNNKVKYLPGEIDFIFKSGKRLVPIEVKAGINSQAELLEAFVKEQKLSFGILLYGGIPRYDAKTKILYWPYWLC